MLRKGDKLYPVSWKKRASGGHKAEGHVRRGGKDAIGFIGSNRTSNEENYLLQSWRGPRLEPTTSTITARRLHRIDHRAGDRAGDSLLTMEQLYQSKAVLLVEMIPRIRTRLSAGKFAVAFAITALSCS